MQYEFAFVANRKNLVDHGIVLDPANGYKAELQKNATIGCGLHTCKTTTLGGVLTFPRRDTGTNGQQKHPLSPKLKFMRFRHQLQYLYRTNVSFLQDYYKQEFVVC